VTFIVGLVASSVGGIMVMGDPGPDHVKHVPSWILDAAVAAEGLILVGLGLLLASPIYELRARRARRRSAAAESRHGITEAH